MKSFQTVVALSPCTCTVSAAPSVLLAILKVKPFEQSSALKIEHDLRSSSHASYSTQVVLLYSIYTMAAIIVVQVGQCGNQVGERLFSKLHSHFKPQTQSLHYDSSSEEGRSIFFRGAASTARAVLVDTEPKAIDATARAAGPGWRYDARSQVTTSNSLHRYLHCSAADNLSLIYHNYDYDYSALVFKDACS
jgi:Tubulin/FtsZ family, GTPase domain